eukprot:scaffold3070_cov74-Skeletonema_marinoi.AAC.1
MEAGYQRSAVVAYDPVKGGSDVVEMVQQARARDRARLGLDTEAPTREGPMDVDDDWLQISVDKDKQQFASNNSELLDDGEGKTFRVGGEVMTTSVQRKKRRKKKHRRRREQQTTDSKGNGSSTMLVEGMPWSRLTTLDYALDTNTKVALKEQTITITGK